MITLKLFVNLGTLELFLRKIWKVPLLVYGVKYRNPAEYVLLDKTT